MNILVINAHPNKESFCNAVAQTYTTNAQSAGHEVSQIVLREMKYDYNLAGGYQYRTEWESDLEIAWQKIQAAQHIVIVYPTWWGTMPANLKGFVDRLFLPGKAFSYRPNSPWWDKLLKGKTAHIITTMDTPAWYYKLVYSNAGVKVLKNNILGFCGIKTKKVSYFAPLKTSTITQREVWLRKVATYAKHGI